MCAQPVRPTDFTAPASQQVMGEAGMAKPAANPSASSISSMQSNNANIVVTPEAIALAMQLLQAGSAGAAANVQKAIILPDGSTYTGETKDGQPHGRGVLQYAPTDEKKRQRYEGEFFNGLRHGEGTIVWLDGDRYIGGWKNGNMHGRGNHTYADGRNYQGAYDESWKHGQGVMRWPDGRTCTGIWEKGILKQGKLTLPDGGYSEGIFKDDKLWEGTQYHIYHPGQPGSYIKYKNGKEDSTCNIS